jgi:hypothetical protein
MSEMIWPASGVAWAVVGVAYAALWVWLIVRVVNRRKPWAKWTAVGLVAVSVLYVVSSGPMMTVGWRSRTSYTPSPLPGSNAVMATTERGPGVWWPQVYAPLLWASDKSWGEQLYWYWELFPVREEGEPS